MDCRVCGIELTDVNSYFSQLKQYNWICINCFKSYNEKNRNRKVKSRLEETVQKEICEKYISGISSHKLSNEYLISVPRILDILRYNNIKIKTNSESWVYEHHFTDECREKIRQSVIKRHNDSKGKGFFPDGFIPWNKNTKGIIKLNSGSFKKGLTPWNKIGEGVTSLYKLIRGMPEYNEWRLQVFGRDNFTCQECNGRGCYLEAHHIKPFNKIIKEYNMKTITDARLCQELWDLNNGITLCKECHMKTNNYKNKGVN